MTLALVSKRMNDIPLMPNSPATEAMAALTETAAASSRRLTEQMKELVGDFEKPHSVMGEIMPRRGVIHGCQPG